MRLRLVSSKEGRTCGVAVAGIGGAGCKLVQLHRQSTASRPNLQHLAVNTDRNTIAGIEGMPSILLHADASGTEAVMPWLAQCKALCLLAGLGGRAGSVATPALARLAHDAGLHTVALVCMPFDWEGRRRRTAALHALDSVQKYASETVIIHGDDVAERLGDDCAMTECIAQCDALLLRELETAIAPEVI